MGFGEAFESLSLNTSVASLKVEKARAETMTEFSVAMPCGGCAKSVRSSLEKVDGVKSVDVQLAHKVVRVASVAPLGHLTAALERTGKNHRLVAHGLLTELSLPHAVAEFKGPDIFGIVRFQQLSHELSSLEAYFEGLPVGRTSWAIHSHGDLTRGAESTGPVYGSGENRRTASATDKLKERPLGDLDVLQVDQSGAAKYPSTVKALKVADIIGRSIVVHVSTGTSPANVRVPAVIALSSGGKVDLSLCGCDGTLLWQAASCPRQQSAA